MGQKLFEDRITTLSESGGTISLAAGARLTIGGQQYVTSSVLDVAADLSTANTRYQIYAVLSGGVPTLVVSQNENSVGPAGENAWKLVGSYYTNGASTVAFGSFVNIDGAPTTKNGVDFDLVISSGTLASSADIGAEWRRRGDTCHVMIQLQDVSQTGAVNGSGNASFDAPFTAADISRNTSNIGHGTLTYFDGRIVTASAAMLGPDELWATSAVRDNGNGTADSAGNWNFTIMDLTALERLGYELEYAVDGWDSTPIKDL